MSATPSNYVPAVAPRRPLNWRAALLLLCFVLASAALLWARQYAATNDVSLAAAFVAMHARLSAYGWNLLYAIFVWEWNVVCAVWDALTAP